MRWGGAGLRRPPSAPSREDPPDEALPVSTTRGGSGGNSNNGRRGGQSEPSKKAPDPSDEAPSPAVSNALSAKNTGRISLSNVTKARTDRGPPPPPPPPPPSSIFTARHPRDEHVPEKSSKSSHSSRISGRVSSNPGKIRTDNARGSSSARPSSTPPSRHSVTPPPRHRYDHDDCASEKLSPPSPIRSITRHPYDDTFNDGRAVRRSDKTSNATKAHGREDRRSSHSYDGTPFDEGHTSSRRGDKISHYDRKAHGGKDKSSRHPSSKSFASRHSYDDRHSEKFANRSRGHANRERDDDSYNYPLIGMEEKSHGKSRGSSHPSRHSDDDRHSDKPANRSRGYPNRERDDNKHDYPLLDMGEKQHEESRSRSRGSSHLSSGRADTPHSYDDRHSEKSANRSRRYPNRERDDDKYDDPLLDMGKNQYEESHGRGRGSSHPSSKHAGTRHSYDDRHSDKSTNRTRGYANKERGKENYDYPFLDMEEKQYEEYQEQLYQQNFSQPQLQSSSQRHQQEQSHFSSTHRQFNLAPIYDDKKETDRRNNENDDRQKKSKKKGSRSSSRSRSSRGEENTNWNEMENHDQVLAYLENSDDENESLDLEEGEAKRHEEFYNDDDHYEDDDFDDDESRPLRNSTSSKRLKMDRRPPKSVLSWSEMCLNRSLMLAFAFFGFILIRNRTPWWKEHEQQVALNKHHHHHNIDNTDDDDLKSSHVDPMAVYNSNDDDSTHTRDHDPLGKYTKYIKDRTGLDAIDPNNKYHQTKAGDRISDRAPAKSLHHGFMDENYADRPEAKNSASNAAEMAGLNNKDIDEEKAAFLELVTRSPAKKKKLEEISSSSNATEHDAEEEDGVGEEEVDGVQVIAPPPLPSSENAEAPMQKTAQVLMQESTGGADGGGGEAPLPPSANDEVPIQNTTGLSTLVLTAAGGAGGGETHLPLPTNDEVPMQLTSGVPMQVSTDAADAGGGETPQPPSANEEVPTQSTYVLPTPASTGSDTEEITGESSPPAQDLNSTKTTISDTLSSIIKTPLELLTGSDSNVSGESHEPQDDTSSSKEEVLTGDNNSDSSSGPESSANPKDAQPKEMIWDGSEPAEVIATTTIPSPSKENEVSESLSSEVDAPSSSQQTVSGSSDRDVASNESVLSANLQNTTQAKEVPSDGNNSDAVPQSETSPNPEGKSTPPAFKENLSQFSPNQPIVNQAMNAEEIKSTYKDSYYRWNHPLRPVTPGDDGKDVPVFWRIPRSASGTVESIMSFCYRNVLASSMGTLAGHDQDQVCYSDDHVLPVNFRQFRTMRIYS